MIGVQPYLAFQGNCEEAINFYKDALGAELLFMQRFGESPMADMAPAEKVMHCTLKIGDSHIMACDNMSPDHPTNVGNNISLAIGTNDVERAQQMFDRMSEGGTVTMPMQQTFWAERFGMLTDKFGINWMFNCDKPEADGTAQTTS